MKNTNTEEDFALKEKQKENLFFGISIVSILALTLASIVFFPSASNAVSITIGGALGTLKIKKRPNKKLGHPIRPIELVVLFLIFCQFLFFPERK